MKKVLLLIAFLTMMSCNYKEEKPVESKEVKSLQTMDETKIDYSSYGMQSKDIPKGLEKGSKAPHVELLIQGKKVALSDIYKDQIVAIIFYRGFWCPYCNKQLSEFATRAKELESRKVKLIAITPESEKGIEKTKEKTKANFTIVSDVDGSIQKAFDVDFSVTDGYVSKVNKMLNVSIPENNANGEAELPVPATYVINTKGEIIFSQFDPDYKNRASIDDILNNLPK